MIQFLSRALATVFLATALLATGAQAQGQLTALARAENIGSMLVDQGDQVEMRLTLSQPVPFRIFFLDAPRRMVLDFSEVDWTGFDAAEFNISTQIGGVRVGGFRAGWSRMVVDLEAPLRLVSAGMGRESEARAVLTLKLAPEAADNYALSAGTPPDARLVTRDPVTAPAAEPRLIGDGPLKVVLDPGHGGIDPGAERDGVSEAALMLVFAQELRDVLVRSGGFEVTLTREADDFVPLEARITAARDAGADVFLSLHADAIAEGRAEGATVYTLAARASDAASRKLAERHDRADLLSGVDLSGQDDVIAGVLLDMARTETAPRTDRLAEALVKHLSQSVGMHKRPRLEAGFSVLKSADIPSVLLELGFLSSDRDRAKLTDPEWRTQAAWAVRDALLAWQDAEIAARANLRK